MDRMALTVCAIAALLMTSAAYAATVANRDSQGIRVLIIEDTVRQDQVLLPGKVIDGVCQKGCIIRLNDSDDTEYELEGSERVSVEEGFLYYDSSDVVAAP